MKTTPTEVGALMDENLFMQITSIGLTGQYEHFELLSLDRKIIQILWQG